VLARYAKVCFGYIQVKGKLEKIADMLNNLKTNKK